MSVKGRIVVIDDEVNAAAALETLLKEDGYEVARANDARSGLLLLEKTDPDIVLTDLRMPGMDGLELLAKIKEIRPLTMVIIMTAYGTVKTAVKAMKLGAEDYLGKPIDVEELEVILQRALEKKELLEEARSLRERLDHKYRLDNLVGDFLQFSRTNRIPYRPASVDALLDEVMRLLRPEARAAGVTLRRQRIGADIPDLRVDAERIKQVVINLVQNAIEAMPGGGTTVVESGLVDGRAKIVVRDTGHGLPEGLDVFQLFVTTKARGTGLGLSIAQQIVLEHGGEITAESVPGQGATLTVRLPAAPAEEKEVEQS